MRRDLGVYVALTICAVLMGIAILGFRPDPQAHLAKCLQARQQVRHLPQPSQGIVSGWVLEHCR